MDTLVLCTDDSRRAALRIDGELNGLDYVELGEAPCTLRAYFIKPPPRDVSPAHFRIDGGERVRDIRVVSARVAHGHAPDEDPHVHIELDRVGDYAEYRLMVENLRNVDPRYRSVTFRFHVDDAAGSDCARPQPCQAPVAEGPDIDYLAGDFDSFRRLLLDRWAALMPGWTETHVPDVGVALVELFAYVGDYLSYYQDAVATEAYIGTARRRVSVRRHARLVDYAVHDGCNARAWLCLATGGPASRSLDPARIMFTTQATPDQQPVIFEAALPDPILVRPGHDRILLYAWSNRRCSLPQGATAATLVNPAPDSQDGVHALKPGDILILEETRGLSSGFEVDADPSRRHPVCLTRVIRGADPLTGQAIVEVQWSPQDALPFPLQIAGSTTGGVAYTDFTVARGNVLLAEAGATVPQDTSQPLTVPADPLEAVRFRAGLGQGPVVSRQAPSRLGSAVARLTQDPRQALPDVQVTGVDTWGDVSGWRAVRDLLGSDGLDRAFVAEIDDQGFAQLRFGDGVCGRAPDPGTVFRVSYRIGGAETGNVAADQIVLVQVDGIQDTLSVRNPLAASGGTAPEAVDDVRTLAPQAYLDDSVRAIAASDYAALAEADPRVQGAAATLDWTGSRIIVRVAIDPLGAESLSPALAAAIEARLRLARRIGHEVEVVPPTYVPIDLAVAVAVSPQHRRSDVAAALRAKLGNRVLPDGSLAFFHPDNLGFGDAVYVSRLVATARSVPGVRDAQVIRLEREFCGANGELALGRLDIGPLEVARLDDDPSLPGNGRLELTLRGGR